MKKKKHSNHHHHHHSKHQQVFWMQNVPGNGDCMFLAVILGSTMNCMGLSWLQWNDDDDMELMERMARDTRHRVAQVLTATTTTTTTTSSSTSTTTSATSTSATSTSATSTTATSTSNVCNLVIEKDRMVSTRTLLQYAARNEGLSTEDYIERLQRIGREGGLYGGGPELTVLSNILRRPISIYEVDNNNDNSDHDDDNSNNNDQDSKQEFVKIKCVGTFGKGYFTDPLEKVTGSISAASSWTIHILVMDVSEHEKHACILIPK